MRTLMPLGITLGIHPALLIAMFPAVNGYFFIRNYPTVVAAINFDCTGTTRIGKYILNHSFMVPGCGFHGRGRGHRHSVEFHPVVGCGHLPAVDSVPKIKELIQMVDQKSAYRIERDF